MWARGQAWAIYGYTVVYRETKDIKFLRFAEKVTDIYLKRLPSDYVPFGISMILQFQMPPKMLHQLQL